jgi:FkbM family methyltransferase
VSARSIFLDIGAHWGETLEEALSPLWRFDLVYAFEPDPEAVAVLQSKFVDAIAKGQLIIVAAALSDHAGEATLFGANDGGGASLYAEKTDIDASRRKPVQLIQARRFFAENLRTDDIILAKLNCEGGEVAILNDLIDGGEIGKLARVVIDFDIRKVRGKRGQAKALMRKMRATGFDRFLLAENVMVGVDARARTRNALAAMPEARAACTDLSALPTPPRRPKWTRRFKYFFRYL